MEEPYTCLWEFEVRPGLLEDFEASYGPAGTWARLFRRAPGYIETLLLRDGKTAGRYLTADRWRSEAAYQAFRAEFAEEYAQLDLDCARLTTAERLLGACTEVGSGGAGSAGPRA